jgi:hypothetical protein
MLSEGRSFLGPAPSQVRAEVLNQHQALRSVLSATEAARRTGASRIELAHLAHEIRRRFRAHLSFEERLLVPILTGVDVWGPDRVRDLVGEHARQRTDLDALIAEIESGQRADDLDAILRDLTANLLRDMVEEERDYLRPDLLRGY